VRLGMLGVLDPEVFPIEFPAKQVMQPLACGSKLLRERSNPKVSEDLWVQMKARLSAQLSGQRSSSRWSRHKWASFYVAHSLQPIELSETYYREICDTPTVFLRFF